MSVAGIGAVGAPRTVDQLLHELGEELDGVFAVARPGRLRRISRRVTLLGLLAAAASGAAAYALARPASVATPSRAPSRPPAPAPADGDVVARGSTAGVAWAVAARACGPAAAGIALTLLTGDGSTTTGCGSAARPAGTLYDRERHVALVYGTAPAGTKRVEVVQSDGGQTAPAIVRQAPWPSTAATTAGAVVYVGEVAFAQTVTALMAYGAGSRLLDACDERRCVTP